MFWELEKGKEKRESELDSSTDQSLNFYCTNNIHFVRYTVEEFGG